MATSADLVHLNSSGESINPLSLSKSPKPLAKEQDLEMTPQEMENRADQISFDITADIVAREIADIF